MITITITITITIDTVFFPNNIIKRIAINRVWQAIALNRENDIKFFLT